MAPQLLVVSGTPSLEKKYPGYVLPMGAPSLPDFLMDVIQFSFLAMSHMQNRFVVPRVQGAKIGLFGLSKISAGSDGGCNNYLNL